MHIFAYRSKHSWANKGPELHALYKHDYCSSLLICYKPVLLNMQVNTKKGKWGIFILAFTTTLREGLEAVIFIAGVSAGLPVSSIPIPAVVGIIMGITVGVILYWRCAVQWPGVACLLCQHHHYGITGCMFSALPFTLPSEHHWLYWSCLSIYISIAKK